MAQTYILTTENRRLSLRVRLRAAPDEDRLSLARTFDFFSIRLYIPIHADRNRSSDFKDRD